MTMQSIQTEPAQAPKLLHIGCGPKTKVHLPKEFSGHDETRLDIDASVSPDVVGDMRDLSMFEAGSFDVLYSSHNIEHLYSHEVVPTLKEWQRVLKAGGVAEIRCPDLASVCGAVAENGLTTPLYQSSAGPITALDIFYGHVASMKRGNLFMAHKTGFTKETLQRVLQLAGFSRGKVVENKAGFELIARALK